MTDIQIRAIAVVDVGFTNSKVILYDRHLKLVAERKVTSPHHEGTHYREIDIGPILAFAEEALKQLDAILPIDVIVPCAHGACVVCLDADGNPAVPVMDYTSEPPADVMQAYRQRMPSFEESYSPVLPMALLHAVQLFWQQTKLAKDFAKTTTILPLMQYIAFGLGGRATTEISSMSCQTHLVDMRTGGPSTLSIKQGWDKLFAPRAKAWDVIGHHTGLQGRGDILAGVHDSNANFLRYLAGGQNNFTLLSTGTWIIGFDTDADMTTLDHSRDIVANTSVLGRTVACSRFFGGKEFEILAEGAAGDLASITKIAELVHRGTFACPSFTDSGGPMPNTGLKGRIIGPMPNNPEEHSSLASLYCALMVSESLDALVSKHTVIVDGPFSQNNAFLGVLAALRPGQTILASEARDGTASGAACLALMPDGTLPNLAIAMRPITPAEISGLQVYQNRWRAQA
jgi:sugar (pentulose or hexulose) kinase